MEIVCKKLGYGCGSNAAAIAFARCWCMGVYRNMLKKNAESCDCVEGFAFVYYYELRLLCYQME